jgi:DNA-binding CsgD family transcriptional regulator
LALLRRFTDPRRGIADLDEASEMAVLGRDRILEAFALLCRGLLRCRMGAIRQGLTEQEAGVALVQSFPAEERAQLQSRAHRSMGVDGDGRGTLTLWLAHVGRYAEAVALGEQMIAETPVIRGSDVATLGDAYYGLAEAYAALGQPEAARRAFAQARAHYQASGQHSMVGSTAVTEVMTVLIPYYADDPTERQELAATGGNAWQRASEASPGSATSFERILLVLFANQWPDARQLTALVGSVITGSSLPYHARSVVSQLAYYQDLPEFAWAQITDLLRQGPATEPGDSRTLGISSLQRTAVALALDTADWITARAWLEAHDRWLTWSGATLGQADGQLLWAQYYRMTGNTERAYECAARAVRHATAPRQPLALLAAHRLLGELATESGQLEMAGTHLDAARALADACVAPYERAQTLLACAGLHQARTDWDEATRLLDEARAICQPLRALLLLTRADALATQLPSLGETRQTYPAGLSAREVEVLRLVAAGQSNREIGNALFLSENTVRVHVRHIFEKTRTDNRTAAAIFARDHGLA